MKSWVFSLLVAVAAEKQNPLERVLGLLRDLKNEIIADGEKEQKSYDKYSCWCKDTRGAKEKEIADTQDNIKTLTDKITQAKGERGQLTADLAQVDKDIVKNKESQDNALSVRQKDHDEYAAKREELEAAIAALHKGIQVLAKGTGNTEAALVEEQAVTMTSIAEGVQQAYALYNKDSMTEMDKSLLEKWLAAPGSVPAGNQKKSMLIQAPLAGDYAPASTRIQGILKSMFDEFSGDVQEATTTEAKEQGSFAELKKTLADEESALKKMKTDKTQLAGETDKLIADSTTSRKEAQKQLADDTQFLEETTLSCKRKATAWAERRQLRTEELGGIEKAQKILDTEEARKAFSKSFFFTQTAVANRKLRAFAGLKAMVAKSHNLHLALLAAEIKTTADTDKALKMVADKIDKMIVDLREEAKDDIADKKDCEKQEAANGAAQDSLKRKDEALKLQGDALEKKQKALQDQTEKNADAIKEQKKAMEDALTQRNKDHADYMKALKDNLMAVKLLEKAKVAVSAFGKSVSLAQQEKKREPSDSPPEIFDNKGYKGRAAEGSQLAMIMDMMIETMEKDISELKKDEKAGLAEYTQLYDTNSKSMDNLEQTKTTLEAETGDNDEAIANNSGASSTNSDSADAAKKMGDQISGTNCAWVKTSFKTREDKRKAEIDGLQVAKAALLGADLDTP